MALIAGCQPATITDTGTLGPAPGTISPSITKKITVEPIFSPTTAPASPTVAKTNLPTASEEPSETAPPPTPNLALPSAILFQHIQDGVISGGILVLPEKDVITLPTGYIPISWSPSGENLLLLNPEQGLFIADTFGENPRLLFDTELGKVGRSSWWLNNETLILTIHSQDDIQVGVLDIADNRFELMALDVIQWVQAVDPSGRFWIEYLPAETSQAFIDGTRKALLDNYRGLSGSLQPHLDPNIVFLPSGSGLLFRGCVSSNQTCHLFLAEISGDEILEPQPIIPIETSISYRVAPNEEYIGIVADEQFLLVSLITRTTIHQWPWVDTLESPPSIAWSPNSDQVATAFVQLDRRGIAVLDIQSGAIEELLVDDGSFWVVEWLALPEEE